MLRQSEKILRRRPESRCDAVIAARRSNTPSSISACRRSVRASSPKTSWTRLRRITRSTPAFEGLVAAHKALSQVESQIAATPAEGLRGLVVKLGLHQFLNDHADDSAYADLVRLTGHDPATEICDRFEREAA
jgi:hypothetical protein